MKTRRISFAFVLCGLLLGTQACAFRVLETPSSETSGKASGEVADAGAPAGTAESPAGTSSETAPDDSNVSSTESSNEPAASETSAGDSAETPRAFIPAFEQGATGEGCQQIALNTTMDDDTAWQFVGGKPAHYSVDNAHGATRSILAGLDSGRPYHIYSDARQWITIPPNAISATLRLWWYPRTEEQASTLIQRCTRGDCPTGSLAAGPLPAAHDLQYVLALRPDWTFEWLLSGKANASEWQPLQFDLSRYAGRRVAIQFGVYNDRRGGLTSMFVDDLELWVCLAQ